MIVISSIYLLHSLILYILLNAGTLVIKTAISPKHEEEEVEVRGEKKTKKKKKERNMNQYAVYLHVLGKSSFHQLSCNEHSLFSNWIVIRLSLVKRI